MDAGSGAGDGGNIGGEVGAMICKVGIGAILLSPFIFVTLLSTSIFSLSHVDFCSSASAAC